MGKKGLFRKDKWAFRRTDESYGSFGAFRVILVVKNPPAKEETCGFEMWFWSLGQEDPLEKGKATYSSILAWRIPWTEEPGGLQSTGLQRVGWDWSNLTFGKFSFGCGHLFSRKRSQSFRVVIRAWGGDLWLLNSLREVLLRHIRENSENKTMTNSYSGSLQQPFSSLILVQIKEITVYFPFPK